MTYYIQLERHLPPVKFRMSIDFTWRKIASSELFPTDLLTSDLNEIRNLVNQRFEFEDDGILCVYDPSETNTTNFLRVFNLSLYIHRDTLPPQLSKQQLIETISLGNDKNHNVLILNVFGKFELLYFQDLDLSRIQPEIVVRFESFNANGGYVGLKAAMDESYISSLYKAGLKHWISHLEFGMLDDYNDTWLLETLSESELEVKLQMATSKIGINK